MSSVSLCTDFINFSEFINSKPLVCIMLYTHLIVHAISDYNIDSCTNSFWLYRVNFIENLNSPKL